MARVLNGSQFCLHTPRLSANGMNHIYTYLCLASRSWYSFTDHGGMERWVGGWLVTYRNTDYWAEPCVLFRGMVTAVCDWLTDWLTAVHRCDDVNDLSKTKTPSLCSSVLSSLSWTTVRNLLLHLFKHPKHPLVTALSLSNPGLEIMVRVWNP